MQQLKMQCFGVSTDHQEKQDSSRGRLNGKPVDFEDAIILAGYGRFQHLLLFTSGLCLMAVTIELLSLAYILPAAHCDLELNTQSTAILTAVIFIGIMASSHAWGFLADTKGRKYILIFAILLNCLCTIFSSFAFSVWMLVGFRFLNGIFICGPSAVIYAYLGEFHSRVTRTKAIVWAGSFTSLGLILLPGLAWVVIPQPWSYQLSWYSYSSWRLFQLMTVLPGVVAAALLLFRLPESPKFLLSRGRQREALVVLQHIFTANSGCRADQYPVTALIPDAQHNYSRQTSSSSKLAVIQYMWNQTWPIFAPPKLSKIMLLCLLQFGLYSCSSGVVFWLPNLFTRLAHFPTRNIVGQHAICDVIQNVLPTANWTLPAEERIICNATINEDLYLNTLILGGVSTIGFLITGYVINLVGRKTVLFTSLLTSGCAGIGMYFVMETSHILVLACVFVALSSTCISIVNSTTMEVFPTSLRAMALCISLMMGRLGTLVAFLLMGLIIELNCSYVFYILGGTVIVCGFLSLLLPAHSTSLPPTLIT